MWTFFTYSYLYLETGNIPNIPNIPNRVDLHYSHHVSLHGETESIVDVFWFKRWKGRKSYMEIYIIFIGVWVLRVMT